MIVAAAVAADGKRLLDDAGGASNMAISEGSNPKGNDSREAAAAAVAESLAVTALVSVFLSEEEEEGGMCWVTNECSGGEARREADLFEYSSLYWSGLRTGLWMRLLLLATGLLLL